MAGNGVVQKKHDGYANNVLRGLAILAVVALHAMSGIHGAYWTITPGWRIYVALDQLFRFCVPLFVALSSYGFWQKYKSVPLHYGDFIYRQAMKLLPLYLVASIISYGIVRNSGTLWWQLLLGRADYQLYFVPMVFQLYLLFPVVKKLVEKAPWVSLIGAAVFQFWLYTYFKSLQSTQLFGLNMGSDQGQYVWFFSWIFYYILGMHLPAIIEWVKSRRLLIPLVGATLAGWAYAARTAWIAIEQGFNSLDATRFTNTSVMIYATCAVVLLVTLATYASTSVKSHTKWLVAIGAWSYPIYLFHTLVLRVMFLGIDYLRHA